MRSVCVRSRLIPLLILLFSISACGRREPATRDFEMRGQILSVGPDNQLLIKHEDIKGFMPAMTMPYKVKDPQLMRGLATGDLITATLAVADTDAWLTRITRTGSAPITDAVPEPSPYAGIELVKVGDTVPDTTFTADDGHAIALRAWRGSAMALTFIYTRCPLPQFCPLMDRRFADVQRAVLADAALKGHARLVSVSFDPDADTPAVLRAHAATLHADPSIWQFVTAPRKEVDRFAAAFGVNVIRERDQTITHNLKTAVIDPQGRIVSLYDGTEWTVDQIVADLRRAIAPR